MNNELIKIIVKDNQQLVSARDLHEFLEVGRDFTTWVKGRISKYNFIENEDFTVIWNDTKSNIVKFNGNSNSMTRLGHKCDYIITLEMAILLCEKEKNKPNTAKILRYLYNIKNDSTKIIIKEQPRLEYQFGDMLEKITGFKWERQYPIDDGKYRLDFYLENTLIIEYDEEHHKHQQMEDIKRIKYCRDWLATHDEDGNEICDDKWRCPVIRIKKGQELEGINRVIRHLAGFECFDTQYDYDLSCCDLKNR